MNLYYAAQFENFKKNKPGVYKKILAQCKQFRDSQISVQPIELNFVLKFFRILPFTTASVSWKKILHFKKMDVLYIRYSLSDYELIKTIKKLKRERNLRIILELPTYPYEQELERWFQLPLLIKDRVFRKYLYKYIDRIVTFSKDKMIFNIKTINTINSLEIDSILKKSANSDLKVINIISVASLAKWHGYDRFFNGMVEYYRNGGNRKIIYHCVGDGEVLEEYKKIAKENNLQKYVVFYGQQTGELLDGIYNQCTLAIASLGLHRIGGTLGSFLKTREYLAKGLPMITGCDIDILDKEKFPYFLQFPSDESPIDIEKVIEFHDSVYLESGKTQEEIVDEIRDFAYRTCDMSVAMKPIIDYIKSIEE